MNKKPTETAKPKEPKKPTVNVSTETKKEKTVPVAETKQIEVVTHKTLAGEEQKKTVKLKSKQVFEPMQGQFRTVWETVEE